MDNSDQVIELNKYCFFAKNIGKGAFGKVHSGWNKYKPTEKYAIKELAFKEEESKFVYREIQISSSLSHPNLVRSYNCFTSVKQQDVMFFVMELCERSLEQEIKEKGPPSSSQIGKYLKDIADGLFALHMENIVHRDLKPQNILLSNGKCKISDFGGARFIPNNARGSYTYIGTHGYKSPQVLSGKPFGPKTDIGSLGVMTYELVFQGPPGKGKTEANLVDKIRTKPKCFMEHPKGNTIELSLRNLIERMLETDENKRINIETLRDIIYENLNLPKENILAESLIGNLIDKVKEEAFKQVANEKTDDDEAKFDDMYSKEMSTSAKSPEKPDVSERPEPGFAEPQMNPQIKSFENGNKIHDQLIHQEPSFCQKLFGKCTLI